MSREFFHTLVLVETAERNLSALRGMGDPGVFAEKIFGFHAQQAIEKSFMAWIALMGGVYPITHDLALLLAALKTHNPEAARFAGLTVYTRDAVPLRDAAANPGGRPLDRPGVIPRVAALVERVRSAIEDA